MLLGLLYMNSTLTTHKAMNTLQPMLKVGLLKKKKTIVNQKTALFTTQNGAIPFIFHNYSLSRSEKLVGNDCILTQATTESDDISDSLQFLK